MRRTLTILMVCCLVAAGVVPAVGLAAPGPEANGEPTVDGAGPGPAEATAPTAATANNSTTVTVLTYNDVQTAAAKDGNLPRMVELIHQRRTAHDNPVVVAGAGDQIGPHPLSPVSQWRAPVAVFNEVDPAADVIGNHEFDYGLMGVSNATNASEFPWLATNLVNETTGEPFDGTESHVVVERDGVRIGFVGLIDEGATYGKTNIDFAAQGLAVRNVTTAGPEAAERLKREEDVDVVVALAHTGVGNAESIARADDGAIDVIAVGDDEVRYPPREVDGTVVTEAVARATYLGELNLTVTDGEVTAWNGRLINVTDDVPKNETASRIVRGYRANASLDTNITSTEEPLDARFATNYHEESNYGDLVTDAMRAETNATVAITNAGGIRSNEVYGPGNVTGGDVFSTLPFPNTVVTVELTGAELRAVLASQVVTLESETGREYGAEISQQVSGVRFEWVPHEGADPKIRDVYVDASGPDEGSDWVRLEENETYEVAVNSYMADGGSGYPLENATRLEETDELLATTVIDYLEPKGTIAPTVEGRMQRVDAPLGEANVTLDGEGEVVVTLPAPDDLEGTAPGTFVLATPDNRTVAAESVNADGSRLVVRFDDAAATALVGNDTDAAELDLYGEYNSSAHDLVYFERARLGADVTAAVERRGDRAGERSEDARVARVAADRVTVDGTTAANATLTDLRAERLAAEGFVARSLTVDDGIVATDARADVLRLENATVGTVAADGLALGNATAGTVVIEDARIRGLALAAVAGDGDGSSNASDAGGAEREAVGTSPVPS